MDDRLNPVAKGRIEGSTALDSKVDSFVHDAGSFLMDEVIMPGVMDIAQRGLHGLVDMMFKKKSSYSHNSYGSSRVYGSHRDEGNPSYKSSSLSRRKRNRATRIEFDNWSEADRVKDQIIEIFDRNGGYITCYQVSCIAGIEDEYRDHTDTEWGWFDVSTIRIHSASDGTAILTLPRPEYVK